MGPSASTLDEYLSSFRFIEDGKEGEPTTIDRMRVSERDLKIYINSFWTSRQRQASSLHEVSYRACFKPQLPRFFLNRMSGQGDTILDPFSGRGTTVVEAGLMGRNIISNDINPLSSILSRPRFHPPYLQQVKERLSTIPEKGDTDHDGPDLYMFYHPDTLKEIQLLRSYLNERQEEGTEDHIDRWIRMVATNRLTGHSKGFFSVYTLPPNQAVSPERQVRINDRLGLKPDHRNIKELIMKKTKSLLRNLSGDERERLEKAGDRAKFINRPANNMKEIDDHEIRLTVTSPPFLNIVQYSNDNWLRCWFNDIDAREVENRMTMSSSLDSWAKEMGGVFNELFRVTMKGGHVAFEVGEVRNRKVRLEETVIPIGLDAGFECLGVVINQQDFTKTSNIWGVSNNTRGTNTNRVAIFKRPV